MAAYCGRGEWGFQLSIPYAKGDVVSCLGLLWQCVTAGTKAQPGTTADWAPLANGQLLAAKEYNPATSGNPTVTATTAATAPALDATNLALLQTAFPNLRAPASGHALVELECLAWMTAAGAFRWVVLSSSTAGATYNGPDGQLALGTVIIASPSDLLLLRRRASLIIGGLTPGAAFNVYWGGYVSASTGNLGHGISNAWGQATMTVTAV